MDDSIEITEGPNNVGGEILPNLTAWAKEAGINSEQMKTEIIAYMATIGAIALDGPGNAKKASAVAFHVTNGKYSYRVIVERSLNKTPKGTRILIP